MFPVKSVKVKAQLILVIISAVVRSMHCNYEKILVEILPVDEEIGVHSIWKFHPFHCKGLGETSKTYTASHI